MQNRSLLADTKKLAVNWALFGVLVTVPFGLSAYHAFQLLNAGSDLAATTQAVVAGHRSQILSGDIRAVELQVRKALNLRPGETAIFLDEKKARWVPGFDSVSIKDCRSIAGICRDWVNHSVRRFQPIYFDDDQKNLWGFLYVEKEPQTNWLAAIGVTSVFVLGMFVQILGMYFILIRLMKKISASVEQWSTRISAQPKKLLPGDRAPYAEFDLVESALGRLTAEISQLEAMARKEGALQTLRGVGHDILNPVARMKRILGIIDSEGSQGLSLDRDLYLSLETNLKRLSDYAEQLKVMYKRDLGELVNEVNRTNVSDEVRRLVEELKYDPEVTEKEISIRAEIDDNCFAEIAPASLGRMIENLCSNAIQASKTSGIVTVNVTSEGESVRVKVVDTGCGIPNHLKEKIFEAGFTSKANKGTGLGLFVVKQVCEQYRGSIELETESGVGSTFIVSVPRLENGNGLQNSAS